MAVESEHALGRSRFRPLAVEIVSLFHHEQQDDRQADQQADLAAFIAKQGRDPAQRERDLEAEGKMPELIGNPLVAERCRILNILAKKVAYNLVDYRVDVRQLRLWEERGYRCGRYWDRRRLLDSHGRAPLSSCSL